jgi:ABC-type sugar transport system ATPase subunit
VFQNYALYPQMTVAQNLAFALELARLDRETIKRKVAAAAASLGLEPLLGRYPRQTFLGSPAMNLLRGMVDSSAPSRLVFADGKSTPIAHAPPAYTGRDVIFGVRPEDIRLDPKDGFPCLVSLVEPMGSETRRARRRDRDRRCAARAGGDS